jgi:hypothetical protein
MARRAEGGTAAAAVKRTARFSHAPAFPMGANLCHAQNVREFFRLQVHGVEAGGRKKFRCRSPAVDCREIAIWKTGMASVWRGSKP